MGRKVKDAKLDTRSARAKLPTRPEPYWRLIEPGCHLGYYKGKRGGTWVARWRAPGGGAYRKTVIGPADDRTDATDDPTYLDFATAQRRARDWFAGAATAARDETPPYTVGMALDDYLAAYRADGKRGERTTRSHIEAHIRPALGDVLLSELTADKIRRWHRDLATAPARLRSRNGAAPKFRDAPQTADEIRARRDTANRVLATLKAALTAAFEDGKVASDAAWRQAKKFKDVGEPRRRFLTPAEAMRLVAACDDDFRPLVQAAILTGCRYAELAAMRVRDFNPGAGNVYVALPKSGKPRHAFLTDQAVELFAGLCEGKYDDAFIFRRADGTRWRDSQQQRRMREASTRAEIDPPVRFHDLRHCPGSWMAQRGVPLMVIAKFLGHADTRMTERHYAHLLPSHIGETVRENMPPLAFGQPLATSADATR